MWPFSRPRLTVLMICTANVCRSPAAEALMRHHLRVLGAGKSIEVVSAGTAVAAPGRKPDPRILDILGSQGVKARGIRAHELSARAVSAAHRLFVMERAHQDIVFAQFPESQGRVELLDPSGADIPDPYFGSKADVRSAVERIDALVSQHAKVLIKELGRRQGQ